MTHRNDRYYIQRAFVRSIAQIRTMENVVSPRVFAFLLHVYKLNTNDDNRFDDGYYQGEVISAITQAVTVRMDGGSFFLPQRH